MKIGEEVQNSKYHQIGGDFHFFPWTSSCLFLEAYVADWDN